MGFRISDKPAQPAAPASKDKIEQVPVTSNNLPSSDDYRCVPAGGNKSGELVWLCGPVGRSVSGNSDEIQPEEAAFCDMVVQAMKDGEDVPDSWIAACRQMLDRT